MRWRSIFTVLILATLTLTSLLLAGAPALAQEPPQQRAAPGPDPSRETTLDRAAGKLAWELGTSLAVATVLKLLGTDQDAEQFKQTWTAAEQRAERLGVELERLPVRNSTPADNLTTTVDYLAKARNAVALVLIQKYGTPVARMFRLGANVGLLSRTYRLKVTKLNQQLATIIVSDGEGSLLPAEIYRPLADLVSKGASLADVRARLREMDVKMAAFFAAPPASQPTAASKAATTNERPADRTTQQFAWEFGSALAGAAVTKLIGKSEDEYKPLWSAVEKMAATLGVSLEPLPERQQDEQTNVVAAGQYVGRARQVLGRKLAERHGRQAAHAFRLTANLVLAAGFYAPDAPEINEALGKSLLDDGKESGLPDDLWRPVADAVIASSPPEDLRAKLGELSAAAMKFFSNSDAPADAATKLPE